MSGAVHTDAGKSLADTFLTGHRYLTIAYLTFISAISDDYIGTS